MNIDRYTLTADLSKRSFEFLSEGPRGTIRKAILYDKIGPNLYNLVFGDWDEVKQQIDYRKRTNNSDTYKVLATVAMSVHLFMEKFPNATILIVGEISAKARLYRMGLTRHWPEISKLYNVLGLYQGNWEVFTTGKSYQTFSLSNK